MICFDNAGHVQTISDFSTTHCTRNTLAARLRFPLFFFLRKTCFSHLFLLFCIFWSKNSKKENNFSIKDHMQVIIIPLSRNPRAKKRKNKQKRETHALFFFSFVFIYFHFLFIFFISFPFFHFFSFFSFLFIFCSFCSFLLISFHFLHLFAFEKTIANLDHWHVDPLLSFAESDIYNAK